MKKILSFAVAAFCATSMIAQPQLNKDNVEDVLKAMTLSVCIGAGGSKVACL